ncbi:hypothetical protein V1477_021222, partial [Vespula maculifrons]
LLSVRSEQDVYSTSSRPRSKFLKVSEEERSRTVYKLLTNHDNGNHLHHFKQHILVGRTYFQSRRNSKKEKTISIQTEVPENCPHIWNQYWESPVIFFMLLAAAREFRCLFVGV